MRPIKVNPPRGKLADFAFGYALLRDRRVPILAKLLCILAGVAITALLEVFEFPVEEIIAALVPFAGMLGDLVFAGTEAFLGPLAIAVLLLPHVTPAAITAQIRMEREGHLPPIIDI